MPPAMLHASMLLSSIQPVAVHSSPSDEAKSSRAATLVCRKYNTQQAQLAFAKKIRTFAA